MRWHGSLEICTRKRIFRQRCRSDHGELFRTLSAVLPQEHSEEMAVLVSGAPSPVVLPPLLWPMKLAQPELESLQETSQMTGVDHPSLAMAAKASMNRLGTCSQVTNRSPREVESVRDTVLISRIGLRTMNCWLSRSGSTTRRRCLTIQENFGPF